MAESRTKPARRISGAFVLFFMMITSGGTLHAQIAAEMDALLESPAITFTQASRFVLAAADREPAAFTLARENGWLPKKAEPDSSVRLGELCFLVMNAFNMEGSFLYALFPGPRYAFRELDYLRLIPGRRDPSRRVSGEELLRMLDLVTTGEGAVWTAKAPPPARKKAAVTETPPPIPAPQAPAAAEPPALPAAVSTEREQLAVEIRAELRQLEVEDTSVRVEEEGVVISLNNIQFMPDSVELTAGEMTKLREIAAILSRYPGRGILVGGHTAQAGSVEGRLRISTERARAVADFLISLNVRRAEEITVTGYGAERPLGDETAEEGRAMNRRVEIILLDEAGP
jgi:outer membrane protein OmpA-like peptidoglycan-associated protein